MEDAKDQGRHPGGRPLKFQSVEELDRAIQNYFAQCDPHEAKALVETGRDSAGNMLYDTRNVLTQQRPYTMAGLARALGIDRGTLLNYGKRQEFFSTVLAARQRCEEYTESQLYGPYAAGAKFSLANNFSTDAAPYSEKHAVDHTSKGDRMSPYAELTPDELRKLAADDDQPEGDQDPEQHGDSASDQA